MDDDFDDDVITEPEIRPEASLFLDYRGAAALGMKRRDEAALVLRPGLNVVGESVLDAHEGIIADMLDAGTLEILDALPTREPALLELARRTASPDGLAAIEAANHDRGLGDGKSARRSIIDLIADRRRRLGIT